MAASHPSKMRPSSSTGSGGRGRPSVGRMWAVLLCAGWLCRLREEVDASDGGWTGEDGLGGLLDMAVSKIRKACTETKEFVSTCLVREEGSVRSVRRSGEGRWSSEANREAMTSTEFEPFSEWNAHLLGPLPPSLLLTLARRFAYTPLVSSSRPSFVLIPTWTANVESLWPVWLLVRLPARPLELRRVAPGETPVPPAWQDLSMSRCLLPSPLCSGSDGLDAIDLLRWREGFRPSRRWDSPLAHPFPDHPCSRPAQSLGRSCTLPARADCSYGWLALAPLMCCCGAAHPHELRSDRLSSYPLSRRSTARSVVRSHLRHALLTLTLLLLCPDRNVTSLSPRCVIVLPASRGAADVGELCASRRVPSSRPFPPWPHNR